jgi:16S rRNA (cytosine967-C5)-methyltransferase
LAAQAIHAVIGRGASLDEALARATGALAAPSDAGLLAELAFGTLRWRFRLEAPLTALLKRPLKARDADIHALLLVGLYQLVGMRVPDHAAVAETVAAAPALGKDWARGLVNATLRNFVRHRESLMARADKTRSARYAHPQWLIERLKADWPNDWRAILEANNARPPMTLRVNRRRSSRGELARVLAAEGIETSAPRATRDALTLASPLDPTLLPGFAAGCFSVQDAGAQFAAAALDPRPGMRVLDACAAPGGKTCHILEREPDLAQCIALDVSSARLDRLRDNFERLGLGAGATIMTGDARRPDAWWNGKPFERILLDAPCSAVGVIRRHPDIKSLRRPADIERLTATQDELFDALWPLVAPGGKLVYATCSVFTAENEKRVEAALARHADARAGRLPIAAGRPAGPGRQLLVGDAGGDGFYYASLEKILT